MTIQLRDYQQEAVAAVNRALMAGKRSALLVQPTGTGKTVVFSEIVASWNVRTLILAHRDELLTQARDKLLVRWPDADIGLVGSGRDERGHFVTIGSVQSIVRPKRLAALAEEVPQLVIVDEAHHATARTYRGIFTALRAGTPDGAFLLGVTATPGRSDKNRIADVFGEPVATIALADMIEKGYLCDLRGIRVMTTTNLDGVHTRQGDFAEGELAAAINRADRNAVIVESYAKYAPGLRAIAFTAGVAHAHDLSDAFVAAGVPSAAVDGETHPDERRRILRGYMDGTIQVVCNCGVLTEGFDAPETGCIILARPTQSQPLFIQMVGRGLRTADGKDACVVLDITDNCSRHSLVVRLPDIIPPHAARGIVAPDYDEDGEFSARDAIAQPPLIYGGELVSRAISLLPHGVMWYSCGADVEVLDLPASVRGVIGISREKRGNGREGWCAWYEPQQGEGNEQDLMPKGIDVFASKDLVKAWAERKAALLVEGKAPLLDRRARWRAADPSDKQIAILQSARIAGLEFFTKGDASDWIDWRMFLRDMRKPS